MIRKWCVLIVCLVCLAGVASAATLEEVLANYYEARGGLETIQSVQAAKISGKMSMGGGGMEAPFTWYWQRPNKLRLEFTVQGQTGVQAFDGVTGWMYMPFMGKTEPEKMPDEMVKNMDSEADFEGVLVDWQTKGHQVELVGEESVEGTDAYKLKVTRKSGDVSYIYLDAEYFLEIKEEGKRTMRGQELEFETSSGDYKEVEGLMFPHSISSKAKGAPGGQVMTLETIEINPELDESLFSMPETEKPATEPSN